MKEGLNAYWFSFKAHFFCFVLFCFVLSCFVLFCFVLSCLVCLSSSDADGGHIEKSVTVDFSGRPDCAVGQSTTSKVNQTLLHHSSLPPPHTHAKLRAIVSWRCTLAGECKCMAHEKENSMVIDTRPLVRRYTLHFCPLTLTSTLILALSLTLPETIIFISACPYLPLHSPPHLHDHVRMPLYAGGPGGRKEIDTCFWPCTIRTSLYWELEAPHSYA